MYQCPAYGVLYSFQLNRMICQSLHFVWSFYRRRKTTHSCLLSKGTVHTWQKGRYTFKSFTVNTMNYFKINILLPSHVLCDLVLCWCMLHTEDMTGNTLVYTTGMWPQQVWLHVTLPGHPFTHFTWVFTNACVVLNVIFPPRFVMLMG